MLDLKYVLYNITVARQMKTINYQLSSQKCLEEGWTLRAPSPLADEDGDDVFIPEALNPAMLADGKVKLILTLCSRITNIFWNLDSILLEYKL